MLVWEHRRGKNYWWCWKAWTCHSSSSWDCLWVIRQQERESAARGEQDVKRSTDFPASFPPNQNPKAINNCIKYIYTHTKICCFTLKKKIEGLWSQCLERAWLWDVDLTLPEVPEWRGQPVSLEPSVTSRQFKCQDTIAVGDEDWGKCWGRFCWETQILWCKGNKLSGTQTSTLMRVMVVFLFLAPGTWDTLLSQIKSQGVWQIGYFSDPQPYI